MRCYHCMLKGVSHESYKLTNLWEKLEWLNLILIIPGIFCQLKPFLLFGLRSCSFLFGAEAVHFFDEPLFNFVTISSDAGTDDFGESSHEFGVLQIVIPVELYYAIDGLIEGAEYVHDRHTMSLFLCRDLLRIVGSYMKLILLYSLVDPVIDRRLRLPDPPPDKFRQSGFDWEWKRDSNRTSVQIYSKSTGLLTWVKPRHRRDGCLPIRHTAENRPLSVPPSLKPVQDPECVRRYLEHLPHKVAVRFQPERLRDSRCQAINYG